MSTTPRSGREKQLIEFYLDTTMKTIETIPVDEFEFMIRHSDAPARKFRVDLFKHLKAKIEKELVAALKEEGLSERLRSVDECEVRAWDRRVELQNKNINTIQPTERPVVLQNIDLPELLDCKLQNTRKQWLSDLERFSAEATVKKQELAAKLRVQKDAIETILDRLDAKLDRFESITGAAAVEVKKEPES